MNQPTVLIVEDDAALRDALCATVELAGFNVESADDGRGALELIDTGDYSLVVSDVQMGGMDGHSLLQKLKSSHPALPVVLILL